MNNKTGKLYLVPTPIGNLKDITFRAIEVLKNADLIGAEDTRTSGYLLKHYQISTPMVSYHKYNEKKRSAEFIRRLLNGEKIAIISDAGSPGISDPAWELVKLAVKKGITIESLPGATALIPAITASGLNTDRFYFAGFLPEKKKDKDDLIDTIKDLPDPLIFYVSPHDLFSFAEFLYNNLGNRELILARELTKLHEEYIRTDLKELLDHRKVTLKGEFVAVISGKQQIYISDEKINNLISQLREENCSNREIIDRLVRELKLQPNRIKKLLY